MTSRVFFFLSVRSCVVAVFMIQLHKFFNVVRISLTITTQLQHTITPLSYVYSIFIYSSVPLTRGLEYVIWIVVVWLLLMNQLVSSLQPAAHNFNKHTHTPSIYLTMYKHSIHMAGIHYLNSSSNIVTLFSSPMIWYLLFHVVSLQHHHNHTSRSPLPPPPYDHHRHHRDVDHRCDN